MTLRERIADWISGGALTLALNEYDRSNGVNAPWFDKLSKAIDRSTDMMTHRFALQRALRKIIECETPSANSTVRRMAAIARDALK